VKKLAFAVIIAGIALLAYPVAKEYFYDREQNELLEEIESDFASERPRSSLGAEYERLARVFDEAARQEETEETPSENPPEELDGPAIAVIEIDKIDLKLPVLEGATNANMKVGAAHMIETAPLGEAGNAAIAAHRARTKGRQFNRLNEVEIGDRIDIRLRNGAVSYVVNEIKIVEPTDLSVLESKGDATMLTLITCEPMGNPTHRLIVHAVKADDPA